MNLRFGAWGVCALFGLLCLVGCGHRSATAAADAQDPPVSVAPPIERDVIDYVFFTGRLEAVDSVNVQARATGYLNEVFFQAGSAVKTNERLFKIDPRPAQAALDQAKGQVALAEARLKLAKADLARALEVARTPGAISQQQIDQYAAAEDEASAALQVAIANRESAELNLEFTDVNSPIDGVVGRALLTQGNLVHQDSSLLTTIVSQDPIYGYFDVDEITLLRINQMIREGKIPAASDRVRAPVEMSLADEGENYPHHGTIDFVNNQVGASTGTLEVRGVFPNPELKPGGPRQFRSGQFVRVRVPLGEPHPALLVPQAAIGSDQSDKYLYVVNDQDVVEYRPIELGMEQPGGLQVVVPVPIVRTSEGIHRVDRGVPGELSLKPGEKVIVAGLQRVHPGMKVQPKPAPSAAPSAAPAPAAKP